MSVVELRFYDGDAPNGALLDTLTDEECSAISLRVALRGLGAGQFSISRSHPSAGSFIRRGNYVRVVIPSIQSDPVWGFWLWEGSFNLLDTQGDDTLTFSGPGPLGILRDAILHEAIFAPGQPRRGNQIVEGYWNWNDVPYGAILVRVLEEGQYQTGLPFAPISFDFDRTSDSASVTWPNIDNEFQVPILSNVLRVFEMLRDAGDLFVFSDPDFGIQAFQTFGTDRTSTTFAAGKILLNETNILTGLSRRIHATNELTHIGLRDKDGLYHSEVHPSYTTERARWGSLDVPETNDPAQIAKVGQHALVASTLNTDAFELEVTPGDDEAIGRYLPWLHYNVGDTATVDVSTGLLAYDNADAQIVAFRVELDEAADDATDDTAHRSLHTVLEFNAATSDGSPIEGRAVGSGPGCKCLELCRDATVAWQQSTSGAPLTTTFDGSTFTATAPSGTVGSVRRWADVWPGGQAFTAEMRWRVLMHWDEDVDNWGLILSMDGQPDPENSTEWATLAFDVSGGFFQATLETSEGGNDVHSFGASGGNDQEHEFYVRVQIEDGAVRARIWDVGDPEPGTWTLEDAVTNESALDGTFESVGLALLGVLHDGVSSSNFEVELLSPSNNGTCIHGGPDAFSGTSPDASPGDHEHDYVAAGGTTGQALIKASNADWDTTWGTAGVSDHGALTGLGDDDHTQYVAHADVSPAEGFIRKTGSGTYTAHKSNLGATAAPTVNDDSGDGYSIGSTWLDTTADKGYVALDVTVGAAVWKETTASPTGGTVTVEEEDGTPTGDFDTIKFPNGSVTDNGDGSVSVDPGGGSGDGRIISTTQSIVHDDCFGTALQGGIGITTANGGTGGLTAGQAQHPGIVRIDTGATNAAGRAVMIQVTAGLSSVLFGTALTRYGMIGQIRTAISDGTDRFTLRLGFGDSNSGEHTDGVYFRQVDNVNAGNYEAVCRSNGTETTADTGVAPDTNWHLWEIEVNAAGTSVEFFIDAASVATITTNIPTGTGRETALSPAGIIKSVGTALREFIVDAFWYHFDFPTPRP